jgi:peptidoglycan/LPS O-acetylase OafA/YrhL
MSRGRRRPARLLAWRPPFPPLALSLILYAGLLLWDERRLDMTFDLGFVRCLAGFYLGSALLRIHRAFGAGFQLGRRAQQAAEVVCLLALVFCVNRALLSNVYVVGAIVSFAATISTFSSRAPGVFGTLLEHRWLRKLGLWSYSIYLLHLVCYETAGNIVERAFGLDLAEGVGLLALVVNSVVLFGVIVLSRFSYEWIENPCRSFIKAYLASAPPPRSVSPPRPSRTPPSIPQLA